MICRVISSLRCGGNHLARYCLSWWAGQMGSQQQDKAIRWYCSTIIYCGNVQGNRQQLVTKDMAKSSISKSRQSESEPYLASVQHGHHALLQNPSPDTNGLPYVILCDSCYTANTSKSVEVGVLWSTHNDSVLLQQSLKPLPKVGMCICNSDAHIPGGGMSLFLLYFFFLKSLKKK